MLLAPPLMLAGPTDCHSQTGARCLKHTGDGAGKTHPEREAAVK